MSGPRPRRRKGCGRIRPPPEETVARLTAADRLALLLDYDGTLVPISPTPEEAQPQQPLLEMLGRLARRAGTSVHMVSGRPADVLTAWFGHLPLDLWAEHGAYHRRSDGDLWEPTTVLETAWMADVDPLLQEITALAPGSLIERKHASIAWHYRLADPDVGAQCAHELRVRLRHVQRHQPIEVLEGRKVVEIRMRGVSKAAVARHLKEEAGEVPAILAIGDDWTDEDLFNALPESAVTIAVGRRASSADYQLPDDLAVRTLLAGLMHEA